MNNLPESTNPKTAIETLKSHKVRRSNTPQLANVRLHRHVQRREPEILNGAPKGEYPYRRQTKITVPGFQPALRASSVDVQRSLSPRHLLHVHRDSFLGPSWNERHGVLKADG